MAPFILPLLKLAPLALSLLQGQKKKPGEQRAMAFLPQPSAPTTLVPPTGLTPRVR